MGVGIKRGTSLIALVLLAGAPLADAKTEAKSAPAPAAKKVAPAPAPAPRSSAPGAQGSASQGNMGRPANALPSFGGLPPPPAARPDPRSTFAPARPDPRTTPAQPTPDQRSTFAPSRPDPRAGLNQPRPPIGARVPPGTVGRPPIRMAAPGGAIRPQYHPAVLRTARPLPMLSQRVARCTNPTLPGCRVWGQLRGPEDVRIISGMSMAAERSGASHRAWIGADGNRREVWINYTPAARVDFPVVFVPAGAVVLGAGEAVESQYYYDSGAPAYDAAGSGYDSGGAAYDSGGTASGGPSFENRAVAPGNTAPGYAPPPGYSPPGYAPPSPGPGSTGPTGPGSAAPGNTGPGSTGPGQGSFSAAAAIVQNPICRTKEQISAVGGDRDQATQLECRDANGDWAPAVRASDLLADSGDGQAQ